jgi:hypothetical protein
MAKFKTNELVVTSHARTAAVFRVAQTDGERVGVIDPTAKPEHQRPIWEDAGVFLKPTREQLRAFNMG